MTFPAFIKALFLLLQCLILMVSPARFPRVPHEEKLELVLSLIHI